MCKQVEIFTDGSCLGNPGPGGYSYIARFQQYERTFFAGYYFTTNNRMELMAAIISLESLKETCQVVLNTDSRYTKQGITEWIYNWKRLKWKTTGKKVRNIDLWKRLEIAANRHKITWKLIKGHAGHLENERCNKLARMAALNPNMEDVGFKF